MKFLLIGLVCLGGLFVVGVVSAFVLIASSPPRIGNARDVFGFASFRPISAVELPALQRYTARDGEELAYRLYESSANRILIFMHGSSYHGGGYHALASAISVGGGAKVVLPNLRGHYMSGRRHGDVGYIGQLEDDIADLVQFLRDQGLRGEIVLGGHSSGAGLAIRFAGGDHAGMVTNYVLLSPIIPTSPAVRGGTAGGWASLHAKRLYGLLFMNALGIHGFDDLPIIEFNKPAAFWDGTETLSYSHRLNASYHPRFRYAEDVRALGDKALVMVGADDEAVDPEALRSVFADNAPGSPVNILPQVKHFQIFTDPNLVRMITERLARLLPR